MPCEERRTLTVNLPNLNQGLMEETLIALDLAHMTYKDGKLSNRGYRIREDVLAKIKQTYAKKAVKRVAKKHGWSIANEKADTLELER